MKKQMKEQANSDQSSVKKRIEFLDISQLVVNPEQSLFAAPTDREVRALADDIERNGLINPVEVARDRKTIICGHSRVAALKLLGHPKVEVWIRDDLTPSQAKQRLVQDNMNRRQMTKLEIARCAQRLIEIEEQETGEMMTMCGFKARIAAQFNMSPRNLDRLLAVLKLPVELQYTYDRGQLSMDQLTKVVRMYDDQREQLMHAIAAGEAPDVAFLRISASKPQKAISSDVLFKRAIAAVKDAEERVDIIEPAFFTEYKAPVSESIQILKKLFGRLNGAKSLRETFASLGSMSGEPSDKMSEEN